MEAKSKHDEGDHPLKIEQNKSTFKGGRPSNEKRLMYTIRIRIDEEGLLKVNQTAKTLNIKVGAYCRKMILNGKVVNMFSEDAKSIRRQLIGIANNLNQLVKEAHTYGLLSVEVNANELLNDIRAILRKSY